MIAMIRTTPIAWTAYISKLSIHGRMTDSKKDVKFCQEESWKKVGISISLTGAAFTRWRI
jgi:hypothetical protein